MTVTRTFHGFAVAAAGKAAISRDPLQLGRQINVKGMQGEAFSMAEPLVGTYFA
jgi:hypothetical protein